MLIAPSEMNKITFKCFFQQFRTLEQSGFSFFQFLLAIQIILVSLEKLLIFHIHKLWNSDGGQEVGGIITLGHSGGGIEVLCRGVKNGRTIYPSIECVDLKDKKYRRSVVSNPGRPFSLPLA